jgi:hypothetical protein
METSVQSQNRAVAPPLVPAIISADREDRTLFASSARESMFRTLFPLAGFQVILIGGFWVIADAPLLNHTPHPWRYDGHPVTVWQIRDSPTQ